MNELAILFAVACALYLYAVYPEKPSPPAIISLMRETSTIDQKIFASEETFSNAEIDLLKKQVSRLRHPPDGRQRKLDAGTIESSPSPSPTRQRL